MLKGKNAIIFDDEIDSIYGDNDFVKIPKQLFIQVPIEFIKYPEYKMKYKMLYMCIWTYGISNKYGYPSQSTLAYNLNTSVRNVISTLAELQDLGGIFILRRYSKTTKERLHNLYYLAEINKDGSFNTDSLEILYTRFPTHITFV